MRDTEREAETQGQRERNRDAKPVNCKVHRERVGSRAGERDFEVCEIDCWLETLGSHQQHTLPPEKKGDGDTKRRFRARASPHLDACMAAQVEVKLGRVCDGAVHRGSCRDVPALPNLWPQAKKRNMDHTTEKRAQRALWEFEFK